MQQAINIRISRNYVRAYLFDFLGGGGSGGRFCGIGAGAFFNGMGDMGLFSFINLLLLN